MKEISGGVVAAKGFRAAGIRVGVKATALPMDGQAKKDLMLLLSDRRCAAAGMFTTNQVKAAPVYVTKDHIADGACWGVIANSGNANACAPNSKLHALEMCEAAAEETGLEAKDFAVASTGVIGQELNIAPILKGMPTLAGRLSRETQTSDDAARSIMTTDTVKKEIAFETEIGGKTVRVGGIAKGHPDSGELAGAVSFFHDILRKAEAGKV